MNILNRKIQRNNKNAKKNSRLNIKKPKFHFNDLPREMIFNIVEKMDFQVRKKFRETSTQMKSIVDYEQKWEYKKSQLFTTRDPRMSIYHFADDFTPPILHDLIKLSSGLERTQNARGMEMRDAMLTQFFQQAQGHYDDPDLKILFTLTMLDLMKNITNGIFFINRPTHQDSDIIISFVIEKIFLAILWASKSISHFAFDEDFPNILVMLTRILHIKEKLPFEPTITYRNFEYLDFGKKLVLVGSKVDYWRPKPATPIMMKWDLRLQGNLNTVQAFKDYMNTGIFDWIRADAVHSKLSISSPEARKCNFFFCYFMVSIKY